MASAFRAVSARPADIPTILDDEKAGPLEPEYDLAALPGRARTVANGPF